MNSEIKIHYTADAPRLTRIGQIIRLLTERIRIDYGWSEDEQRHQARLREEAQRRFEEQAYFEQFSGEDVADADQT